MRDCPHDPEAHLSVELAGEKRILTWSELDEISVDVTRPVGNPSLDGGIHGKERATRHDRIAGCVDFPSQK